MRYYNIVISDAKTGTIVRPPGFAAVNLPGTYTSYVNGQSIPGAWQVEFDIPVGPAASPMGGALIRVWGISLAEIAQANDLVNKKIKVFGGMQKGLPLANPKQAGLLVEGYVYQAFGNWVNTEQSLDIVVMPGDPPTGPGSYNAPINLVLDWKKGTPMGTAIKNTLSTAFPGFEITVDVSDKLIYQSDQPSFNPTLTTLGQWAKQFSKNIIKDEKYNGVDIVISGKTIKVYDGTKQQTAKQIEFVDLIGQPTWIEAPLIQVKTVMRADLAIGQTVKLPKTVVTNTAAAQTSLVPNQKLTFQGEFMIQQLRHLGSFRQATAEAWVTVFNASPTSLAT